MTRAIQIFDEKNKLIGELMTASDSDVLKYLAKGFVVVEQKTGEVLTEAVVSQGIGVSDGTMLMDS